MSISSDVGNHAFAVFLFLEFRQSQVFPLALRIKFTNDGDKANRQHSCINTRMDSSSLLSQIENNVFVGFEVCDAFDH